jgi:ribonucleotide monophosphatase NagD (HAD superfamily)
MGRILAIGDSLEHDIAGGHAAGCLTALVAAGIHRTDLAEPGGLERLSRHYGVMPDFVIPKLDW